MLKRTRFPWWVLIKELIVKHQAQKDSLSLVGLNSQLLKIEQDFCRYLSSESLAQWRIWETFLHNGSNLRLES